MRWRHGGENLPRVLKCLELVGEDIDEFLHRPCIIDDRGNRDIGACPLNDFLDWYELLQPFLVADVVDAEFNDGGGPFI